MPLTEKVRSVVVADGLAIVLSEAVCGDEPLLSFAGSLTGRLICWAWRGS